MRKESKNGGSLGKVVAKSDLPSKVCVVCNRPFSWRKKWERVWDEVTTCSKSCNAKRKSLARQGKSPSSSILGVPIEATDASSSDSDDDDDDDNNNNNNNKQQQGITSSLMVEEEEDSATSWSSEQDPKAIKKMLRKQHKEAVKAKKLQRRAKRMGDTPEAGRKPCDMCQREVDMLIRCTIDASAQFKMVCGKCWPSVSGGAVDGSPSHPHYKYGGLWKNRNANLKKKVGSGPSTSPSLLVDQLERNLRLEEE